jgi:hypothetical protein
MLSVPPFPVNKGCEGQSQLQILVMSGNVSDKICLFLGQALLFGD